MSTRRQRTQLQRAAIFQDHGGICHLCGHKIMPNEAWELEHVIAFELTRDDTDENLRPAHVKCHKAKTKDDVRAISKAKRVSAKHLGAKKPVRNPLPGSKGSKFKSKIGGGWEPR